MGIHPESFNEREHCWTDYESPSSPPGLQPEFPWPPPDREHRARAAEHRFLAVWSAAVYEPAAAADRVQHNNKLRALPAFHPFGLLPTTSRLWGSNLGRAVQDPWPRPGRGKLQAGKPVGSGKQLQTKD